MPALIVVIFLTIIYVVTGYTSYVYTSRAKQAVDGSLERQTALRWRLVFTAITTLSSVSLSGISFQHMNLTSIIVFTSVSVYWAVQLKKALDDDDWLDGLRKRVKKKFKKLQGKLSAALPRPSVPLPSPTT